MSDYIELAGQLRLLAKVDECSQRPPVNGRFDRAPCEKCEYRDRCLNSPPPDFSAIFNEAAYAIEALHGEIDSLHELGKADRLLVLPSDKARWINAILVERDSQDKKWGPKHGNTYSEWGSLLAEEAGELCKELNELNYGRGDRVKMETEAVQVAALALLILEQANVAHEVTALVAKAMGRPFSLGAEAALERMKEADA